MESYSNLNEEDTSTCPLLTHEAPKASNDDVQEDPEDENKRVDSDSSEQNSNSSNSTDDDDSLPLNMDDEEVLPRRIRDEIEERFFHLVKKFKIL